MAPTNLAVASVTVDANLDPLEKGLSSAKTKLEQFDKAAGGQNLSSLTDASRRAQISLDDLSRQLAITQKRSEDMGVGFANASSKMATAANSFNSVSDKVVAANDNINKSVLDSASGFVSTVSHVKFLGAALLTLGPAAYGFIPAFKEFVNLKAEKAFELLHPAVKAATPILDELGKTVQNKVLEPFKHFIGLQAQKGFDALLPGVRTLAPQLQSIGTNLQSAGGSVVSFGKGFIDTFSRLAGPVTGVALVAVAGFKLVSSAIEQGSALLAKYGDAWTLFGADVEKAIAETTKFQFKDSADQVQKATELAGRLKDAQFILSQMVDTTFDLKDPGLRFLEVWVNINEALAATSNWLSKIFSTSTNEQSLLQKFGNASFWKYLTLPGDNSGIGTIIKPPDPSTDPKKLAQDQLMIALGLKAIKAEGKDTEIGSSFMARFTDDLLKLADAADKTKDTWDRATTAIKRQLGTLEANSVSVGKSVGFQASLRAELQLLQATKTKDNEITEEQITKYAELRGEKSIDESVSKSGMKVDQDRITILKELSKAIGLAALGYNQATFAQKTELASQGTAIAVRALTAYSPAQKAAIAADQKRLELLPDLRNAENKAAVATEIEKQALEAGNLARLTTIKQLEDSVRARQLASAQTVKSAQLEIDTIGKTVGEQYVLQANLQTRQELERDASQRRATVDEAEYQRLIQYNAAAGQRRQLAAELGAQSKADFDLQTALLTDTEKQVAALNFQLHGNAWKDFMNDGLSATTRLAAAMNDFSNFSRSTVTSFLTDMRSNLQQGQSAWVAFGNAATNVLNKIADKLISMAVDNLWKSAFPGGGGGGFLSSIIGLAGGQYATAADAGLGGGSAVGSGGFNFLDAAAKPIAGARGMVLMGGNVVPFANGGIISRPTLFPMRNGGTGLAGEAGDEAVVPLVRTSGGKLGVQSQGGATVVQPKIIINNNASDMVDIKQDEQQNSTDPESFVLGIVKKGHGRGAFDAPNQARYGLRARKVR